MQYTTTWKMLAVMFNLQDKEIEKLAIQCLTRSQMIRSYIILKSNAFLSLVNPQRYYKQITFKYYAIMIKFYAFLL